jgi:uncharacterized protein (TIGR03435 family)
MSRTPPARIRLAILGLLAAGHSLSAQSDPPFAKFEAASVKPVTPSLVVRHMSNELPDLMPIAMQDPGRVSLRFVSLLWLAASAYHLPKSQVKGPSWMDDQFFDVLATLPAGAPANNVDRMLQSLLKERFDLECHREVQQVRGYALVVGKSGPKLKTSPSKSAPSTPDEQRKVEQQLIARARELQSRSGEDRQVNREERTNFNSEELASWLGRLLHVTVVDQTDLQGLYDVALEIRDRSDPGPDVFRGVEKLGLKLEPRRVSIEVLVIDKIRRIPETN